MKIATWNVNSINVRLPHIVTWLEANQPDILAVQELKVDDLVFVDKVIPALTAQGYHCSYSAQKTYNGVATFSRTSLSVQDELKDLPHLDDPQRRLLAVTIDDIRIINAYMPNGESLTSEKYPYKLNWLRAFVAFMTTQLQQYSKVIVLGDFNIAPHDRDVHAPELWTDSVLTSAEARQLFADLLALGLTDSFRWLHPDDVLFSWWDYRQAAFRRNMGLRIDHILVSNALTAVTRYCVIDKEPRGWERPSDHTPVCLTLDL